jgi:preprotein translocase subunit SecD
MTYPTHARRWLFGLFLVLAGCSRGEQPRPLAPHATFEIYLVSDVDSPGAQRLIDQANNATLFLTPPPLLEASDVATIVLEKTDRNLTSLTVQTTPAGAARLEAASSAAVGKRIAVMANGQLIALATLNKPLSATFVLSGEALHRDGARLFDALTQPP